MDYIKTAGCLKALLAESPTYVRLPFLKICYVTGNYVNRSRLPLSCLSHPVGYIYIFRKSVPVIAMLFLSVFVSYGTRNVKYI
jgi:hypothetical protein